MIKNKNDALIFGKNVIFEALRHNPDAFSKIVTIKRLKPKITAILDLAYKHKVKVEYSDEINLDKISNKGNHQNIVAFIDGYKYYSFADWSEESKKRKNEMVLLLDKIEDTHNFGAIIRTAAASGVSAIFVASNRQAPINATVIKTSAGNIFKTKIIQVSNLNNTISKLKEDGFWTYAVDMSDNPESMLYDQDFDAKTAFVLGSEGKGVSEKIRDNCDFITSIPMENNVESLNVSVSAALIMYEYRRQNQ